MAEGEGLAVAEGEGLAMEEGEGLAMQQSADGSLTDPMDRTLINFFSSLQPGSKTHPGMVKSLQLCPTDANKLLIGYEKGVVVLWDLEQRVPIQNYPASLQDCQQVKVRY